MGFNRVSFGVQDTDSIVQEAVRRRQSLEMTKTTFYKAKELGFSGINVDLIYGLPYQTKETFSRTADEISQLGPDRIALFSYAKVPWLRAHQLAIKDDTLPTAEEKFSIYLTARERFLQEGYIALGMDHFGLPQDSLTKAYNEGKLHRNFQGYTLQGAEDMVSFGLTSISDLAGGYFQNTKELKDYYRLIDEGILPTGKGYQLTDDDQIRRWTIRRLMCQFHVDKQEFKKLFSEEFDAYFSDVFSQVSPYIEEGLMSNGAESLQINSRGRLFARNLVAPFDKYLQAQELKRRFSSAI
jgi:oxygen-independent coproporphyrinogen-3 oxidase